MAVVAGGARRAEAESNRAQRHVATDTLPGGASNVVKRGGPGAYFRHLALLGDGVMLALAFPLAYVVKTRLLPADLTPLYAPEVYLGPAALVAFATVLVLERRQAHSVKRDESLWSVVGTVLFAVAVALAFGATVLYAFKLSYVSRLFLALYGLSSAVLLVSVHLVLRRALVRARRLGVSASRVLLVGGEAEVQRLAAVLEATSPFGIVVVDRFSVDDLHTVVEAQGDAATGAFPALDRLLAREAVDEVAVATPDLQPADLAALAVACDGEGVLLHVSMAALGAGLERASLERVGDVSLLSINPHVHSAWARAVKRALDFVVVPVLLLVSLPFWIPIAIAIKVDSRGPVFFRQQRLGLNKRHFEMLKFRTMFEDAEERRSALLDRNEADGPIFKLREDPRETRVGRFLRRFDIDELPQLLNVLAGHMTLVGPRPMMPSEIVDFDGWQRKRFSMYPGLTGLWQVRHRLGDSFLEGLRTDLEYIDRWSLRLDAWILLRTLGAVLRDRGAH